METPKSKQGTSAKIYAISNILVTRVLAILSKCKFNTTDEFLNVFEKMPKFRSVFYKNFKKDIVSLNEINLMPDIYKLQNLNLEKIEDLDESRPFEWHDCIIRLSFCYEDTGNGNLISHIIVEQGLSNPWQSFTFNLTHFDQIYNIDADKSLYKRETISSYAKGIENFTYFQEHSINNMRFTNWMRILLYDIKRKNDTNFYNNLCHFGPKKRQSLLLTLANEQKCKLSSTLIFNRNNYLLSYLVFLERYMDKLIMEFVNLNSLQQIELYSKCWKIYILASLQIDFITRLGPMKNQKSILLTKEGEIDFLELALLAWKSAFFLKPNMNISLETRLIIAREVKGDITLDQSSISMDLIQSYYLLGIIPRKILNIPNISKLDQFHFIQWHLKMYPSIPRVKMQIGSTKNNLRMGVKTSKNPISIQVSFAALPSNSSQIIDSTSKELDWNYIFLEHQLRNDVSNLVRQDELPCTSNSCVALQKDVRKRERSRNNRYNKKNRTEEGNDEDRSELET